jgi:hypothetical protein
MKIKLGNQVIEATLEKGLWIYKAEPVSPFKQNGVLKKTFKDLPRYDVINEYEDFIKKEYDKNLKEAVKRISQKLINFK